MNQWEYRVNEYLTLTLEEERTKIYVNGELLEFYCKPLLLSIPINELETYANISSVDEAEIIGKKQKNLNDSKTVENLITPEQEFWGHCSNLQAWSDNQYNTNVMHSNIAFPLLKKLMGGMG